MALALVALTIIPNLIFNKELKQATAIRVSSSILILLAAFDLAFIKHEDPIQPFGFWAPTLVALIGFIVMLLVGSGIRNRIK